MGTASLRCRPDAAAAADGAGWQLPVPWGVASWCKFSLWSTVDIESVQQGWSTDGTMGETVACWGAVSDSCPHAGPSRTQFVLALAGVQTQPQQTDWQQKRQCVHVVQQDG